MVTITHRKSRAQGLTFPQPDELSATDHPAIENGSIRNTTRPACAVAPESADRPRRTYRVVGKNGQGKSTLSKLPVPTVWCCLMARRSTRASCDRFLAQQPKWMNWSFTKNAAFQHMISARPGVKCKSKPAGAVAGLVLGPIRPIPKFGRLSGGQKDVCPCSGHAGCTASAILMSRPNHLDTNRAKRSRGH